MTAPAGGWPPRPETGACGCGTCATRATRGPSRRSPGPRTPSTPTSSTRAARSSSRRAWAVPYACGTPTRPRRPPACARPPEPRSPVPSGPATCPNARTGRLVRCAEETAAYLLRCSRPRNGDAVTRYLANCSLLFAELPLLRRPAAAREAGFTAVEFWWPFAAPVPADAEVEAFTRAVADAGVRLVGLNLFGGDLAGPDCGVLSVPGRAGELRDNLDVAVGIGERLGVRVFNALYGNRVEGVPHEAQDETAAENLALAAAAAGRI